MEETLVTAPIMLLMCVCGGGNENYEMKLLLSATKPTQHCIIHGR
jgi:hypothetical protein